MGEFFFLPKDLSAAGALLWVGGLMLAAMLAGEILARYLYLPRVVGFVAAGVLLGPQFVNFIDKDALFELRGLLDIARGLVLFEIGQRVDFRWLNRNPGLFASSLLEAA